MDGTAKKPVLWVVSELYYPEMTSTGYYLTKIAEGLAEDYDVRVICGQPNYSARGEKAPKHEILNKVEVFRVFGTRLDKNVIPYRILNMLTLSLSVFLTALFRVKRDEKVLVVTTPPSMPFLTLVSAKLKSARQILLIHDSYPEILYAAGKLKEDSFSARILETLSGYLIRNADRLILVGRDMKKRLQAKFEKLPNAFVVPNWAELETVEPAPRNDNVLLKELNLEDKLVLLYAGNMGYPNDIDSFLACAERLLETDSRVHFVFLGAGVKKEQLVETVQMKGLVNVTVLDPKPRSEQPIFLNACDVGIVSLVSKMYGVSMPSRTYNILGSGKPILAVCEPGSEIDLVVSEDIVGWSVPPDDPDALYKTIIDISENEEELVGMGQRARHAALGKYSLETALAGYLKALED